MEQEEKQIKLSNREKLRELDKERETIFRGDNPPEEERAEHETILIGVSTDNGVFYVERVLSIDGAYDFLDAVQGAIYSLHAAFLRGKADSVHFDVSRNYITAEELKDELELDSPACIVEKFERTFGDAIREYGFAARVDIENALGRFLKNENREREILKKEFNL